MNRIIDAVNHTPVPVKAAMDIGAVGLAWSSFFTDIMPLIATGLSIVWFSLQIYAWVERRVKGKKDE